MTNGEEFSCGLGRWRPAFLQKFANLKYFTIVYGLLGTTQAMAYVYFIATLTTLEKRFQIRSEVTGILMSGNEMSQIFLSIFLAYHGGKGNRPVWIAWGVLFSSLSCFILAAPHFVYGPGANALALTEEFLDYGVLNSTKTPPKDSNPVLCSTNDDQQRLECKEENEEKNLLSLVLIFFSQFVLGVGTTLYVTLGQPYLDDNSKKKNTPKLLGMTLALRTAGPAVGFVLGFLCLNLYIDPSLVPIIERNDPRWLGAWWLGWVILGAVMTIFSLLIATFPRQLKKAETKANRHEVYSYQSVATESTKRQPDWEKDKPIRTNISADREPEDGIFTDFRNALRRVSCNTLLICNILTTVFAVLATSGYINFYTKYSETQFHQSAASSSMIAGVTTVMSMMLGFLISGFVISKFKPKVGKLMVYNVFSAVVFIMAEIGFMFMGCDENTMQGSLTDDGMYSPLSNCNSNCSCNLINYSPVCFERGSQTFFSACHAGCTNTTGFPQGGYTDCSCLPDPSDTVKQGPCKVNCTTNFMIFVAVQCLIQLVSCGGRITNILITYRCVEPRDKPLAQGIVLFIISLFAFIPGPIIYGKVIDSTCLIWDYKCGKRGNCWVYDKKAFRTYMNTTGLCFSVGVLVFDVVICFLARNIKLYEEPPRKGKS